MEVASLVDSEHKIEEYRAIIGSQQEQEAGQHCTALNYAVRGQRYSKNTLISF